MENFKIETLLNLSPRQFEELIQTLLTIMKFNASTTKISGDGGVDIMAVSDQAIVGGRYVIQCKKYALGNNVGEPIVRELYCVVMHENANKGILITTSDFTKQAITFSRNKAIELINGDNIINLLNKYIEKTQDVNKYISRNISGDLFNRWNDIASMSLGRNKGEKCIQDIKQKEIEKTVQAFKKEQLQAIKAATNIRFVFSNLTIRDRETGLIWAQHQDMEGCFVWRAVFEYISKINSNLYAGLSNWRVPTFDELQTITEFAKRWKGYENNISSLLNIIGFRKVKPAYYWTSTGDSISMVNGNTYAHNKIYNYDYNILPVGADPNKEQTLSFYQRVC